MSKIPLTGGVGTPPPAGAPYEVTTPGSERPTPEQIAQAHANEKSLAPLNFVQTGPLAGVAVIPPGQPPTPAASAAAPPVSAAAAVNNQSRIRRVARSRPSVEGGESTAADAAAPGTIVLTDQEPSSVDASRGAVDPPKDSNTGKFQPAASDTESPSRGQPHMSTDPGKQITGGFGDLGEAQYFPLDGSELRELIYALMDDVHRRLQDDLRFTMAICYPRVSARVVIEVNAFVNDQSFEIPKVMVPYAKTPLAVAREHGTEVVFAVVAERVEMEADGTSVSPPNKTRLELGLVVPRKQAIDGPTGRQMVDIPAAPPG